MHHFIKIKVHDNPSHPYDQDTNLINVGLIKESVLKLSLHLSFLVVFELTLIKSPTQVLR